MSEKTQNPGSADRLLDARLVAQQLEAKLDAARKLETKEEDRGLEAKLAALTNLQDWSKWLVSINAGVLGLITFASQTLVGIIKEYNLAGVFLAVAVVAFTASLFSATCLVGSVPAFVMRLKTGESNWGADHPAFEWKGIKNIYDFKYGFTWAKYKLMTYSGFQHVTFLIASLCLAISLILMFISVPAGAANAAVRN